MSDAPDETPLRLHRLPSRALGYAAARSKRLLLDAMDGTGSRPHHYAILATLEEYGPASQATIGRRSSIYLSDIANAIRDLATAGHVDQHPDPADRRRNLVAITPAGRRHLRRLDRIMERAQDTIFAALTPAERVDLAALLHRIADYGDG